MMDRHTPTLILGGGSLAAALAETSPGPTLSPDHASLDIHDTSAVQRTIAEHGIGLVINAAGKVLPGSGPETLPMYDLHATASARLASICAQVDIPFAFISTGRVFDGDKKTPYVESDTPNPIDAYGLSKYMGERMAALACPADRLFIFRLPQLLGVTAATSSLDNNLPFRLLRLLRQGKEVSAATDLTNSYSNIRDVTRSMWRIITSNQTGLHHVSNLGQTSLWELLCFAATILDIDTALIKPLSCLKIDPQRRPGNLALGSERHELCLPWRDALEKVFLAWDKATRKA